MKSSPARWTAILLITSLTGCARLSQFSGYREACPGSLTQAGNWAASAWRDSNTERSAGKSLSALRLAQVENSARASDIARSALSRYAQLNFVDGGLETKQVIGCDGITYRVRIATSSSDWSPQLFDHFDFLRPVTTSSCTPLRWSGWGVPVIGVSNPDRKNEPFAPRRGYRLPVTIVADTHMHGSICETKVRLLNPEKTQSVSIAGTLRPVAADLYAPNKATFQTGNPLILGLRWLFSVDRFSYPTRLVFIQPYDSEKIPVVLVHGLLSTQAMWGKVIRELQSDPEILRNYQFWCFHYPTGQPIPVSALQLRTDLRAAEQLYHPHRGIVLIGHSMGGILSRAQASSSGGNAMVNQIFGQNAKRVIARLPNAPLLRDSLIFERDKYVKRVVFICVPHRGSTMATAGPLGFVVALIRLPNDISSTFSEAHDLFRSININRPPTSICGLSPRSRFLEALNQRPIEAPHHTILGDRGRGDSPRSSDGVVSYSSAHLATAESELIIPCGHGAFRHPKALAEMKRILKEHLLRPNGKHLTTGVAKQPVTRQNSWPGV